MKKPSDAWPLIEVAEIKKKQFVNLVGQLAGLRDLQYANNSATDAIDLANKVLALNLPTNLLRAAAIFVDYFYGFPAEGSSFIPPKWVLAKTLLPKEERGSLICTGFKSISGVEETDVVVLVADIPEWGLHAGMAGIVRELPSEDGDTYLVEFGEPEDSLSQKVEVLPALLRGPRPGDLMENYRW
jgi:hypothetical protein